jgi:hypothetical protein
MAGMPLQIIHPARKIPARFLRLWLVRMGHICPVAPAWLECYNSHTDYQHMTTNIALIV